VYIHTTLIKTKEEKILHIILSLRLIVKVENFHGVRSYSFQKIHLISEMNKDLRNTTRKFENVRKMSLIIFI
jgi:hypothetical protein